MRIIHVLSALYQGGAETQLENLICYSKNDTIEHIVISLKSDETPLMQRLIENKVQVYCAGFNGVYSMFGFLRLRRLLKQLSTPTTIIQCWMYHANLLGLLAAYSSGLSKKIVWNIRRTEVQKGVVGLWATKLPAILSHLIPIRIVCCAESAKRSHIKAGYNAKEMLVIHNGVDTNKFSVNEESRSLFRNEIGVTDTSFVIGMVGRYAPIKDHLNLLQAFNLLLLRDDLLAVDIKLVLIGRDIENAGELQLLLSKPNIARQIIISQERGDIHKVMPGFNLLCLPSKSEGFPNVVVEAMACGVPAIVTDVGDAALIVGELGMVVPNSDPLSLSNKIAEYIKLPRSEKEMQGEASRNMICAKFSIKRAWKHYYLLYTTQLEVK